MSELFECIMGIDCGLLFFTKEKMTFAFSGAAFEEYKGLTPSLGFTAHLAKGIFSGVKKKVKEKQTEKLDTEHIINEDENNFACSFGEIIEISISEFMIRIITERKYSKFMRPIYYEKPGEKISYPRFAFASRFNFKQGDIHALSALLPGKVFDASSSLSPDKFADYIAKMGINVAPPVGQGKDKYLVRLQGHNIDCISLEYSYGVRCFRYCLENMPKRFERIYLELEQKGSDNSRGPLFIYFFPGDKKFDLILNHDEVLKETLVNEIESLSFDKLVFSYSKKEGHIEIGTEFVHYLPSRRLLQALDTIAGYIRSFLSGISIDEVDMVRLQADNFCNALRSINLDANITKISPDFFSIGLRGLSFDSIECTRFRGEPLLTFILDGVKFKIDKTALRWRYGPQLLGSSLRFEGNNRQIIDALNLELNQNKQHRAILATEIERGNLKDLQIATIGQNRCIINIIGSFGAPSKEFTVAINWIASLIRNFSPSADSSLRSNPKATSFWKHLNE